MGASNSQLAAKFTEDGETESIVFAFAAVPDLDGSGLTSFFGVYDGHGGAAMAKYCAKQFHIELVEHNDYEFDPTNALRDVFFRMDEAVKNSEEWRELLNPSGCIPFLNNGIWPLNKWPFSTEYACEGTTACVVLLKEDLVIIGNAGNSCCIISKNDQTMYVTTSPRPNDSAEEERIESAGGVVVKEPWRIKNPLHRMGGLVVLNQFQFVTLPVCRSIGDSLFKQNEHLAPEEQMVICDPEVMAVEITDGIDFLIIASDGLLHCMSADELVSNVREKLRKDDSDLRAICQEVVCHCRLRFALADNMTMILVKFKKADADANANAADITSADTQGTTHQDLLHPDAGRTEDANPIQATTHQDLLHLHPDACRTEDANPIQATTDDDEEQPLLLHY